MRLFDKINSGDTIEIPLELRSSLVSNNQIKFLIRYEVETGEEETSPMAKYRFTRIVFSIDSVFAFFLKRHVHLSTKVANEHIINI